MIFSKFASRTSNFLSSNSGTSFLWYAPKSWDNCVSSSSDSLIFLQFWLIWFPVMLSQESSIWESVRHEEKIPVSWLFYSQIAPVNKNNIFPSDLIWLNRLSYDDEFDSNSITSEGRFMRVIINHECNGSYQTITADVTMNSIPILFGILLLLIRIKREE